MTGTGEAGGWEERLRAESCVPLVCDPPELAASGHCPHTCREQRMLPAWGRAECRATPPSGRRLGVLGKITPTFPFLEGPEDLKRKGTSRHLSSRHGGGVHPSVDCWVDTSDAGDARSAWLSGPHP